MDFIRSFAVPQIKIQDDRSWRGCGNCQGQERDSTLVFKAFNKVIQQPVARKVHQHSSHRVLVVAGCPIYKEVVRITLGAIN